MNPEKIEEPVDTGTKAKLHWPVTRTGMSLVGFSQVGLFVIAAMFALHQMKPVLMPMVLAILVSLILHPVYMAFRKMRFPRILSAAVTVAGLMAILVFGAYQAFLPGAEWAKNVDQEELIAKVQAVFEPMKEVQSEIQQMAQKVENATTTEAEKVAENGLSGAGNPDGKDEDVVKLPGEFKPVAMAPFIEEETKEVEIPGQQPVMVEIREDPVSLLMAETRDFGLGLVAFLLLVLFMLAYGPGITRQLNKDERVSMLLGKMGQDVSRYLFTITLINAGLGIFIGMAMWGLGMPRPALWGVMGMILNFIPYVGALMGTFVIFMAAAVNFEQPGMVLAVPLVYFALTAVEGNVVTPLVLGGRFRINPLAVFVWIFAWAGFWGIAGMLIAMPALVIFKIVCDNTERMGTFRRVLGA